MADLSDNLKRLRSSARSADKGEGTSLTGLSPEERRDDLLARVWEIKIDRENDRIEGDVGL